MTTFGNTTTIPDSSPAYHPHYDDSKCLLYASALFNIVNLERLGEFSSHTIPPFIRLGIQEQFSPDNFQILTIPVGCIVCTAFGRAPTCGVIGLGVQHHPQSNNSVVVMINTKPSTCGEKWLVQVDKNMCLVDWPLCFDLIVLTLILQLKMKIILFYIRIYGKYCLLDSS